MYRLVSFSMTDGPGMAAVLFCKGCQFDCKYCYNKELRHFTKAEDDLSLEDSLDQISKLRIRDFNTVDWLILSGGEPLNRPLSELEVILKHARDMGLKTGIYTTGCFPDKIEALINKKLIDYFHIDYKNVEVMMNTGYSHLDKNSLKSIKLIVDAKIQCHVNTTMMRSIHTLDVLQTMKKNLEQITGAPLKIFINKVTSFKDDVFWSLTPISQNFTDTLAPIDYSIDGWTSDDLENLQSLLD